jgi:ABC-type antimicrobial peptide transport system permease subunit
MATMRKELLAVDSQLRVERMRTLPAMISDTLLQQRLVTQLVTVFGVAALILAAIGLYGMLAYGVVRRTSEIGIRMALGAIRRDVVWLVIRESLFVVAIGLSFGMAGAFAMGSLLESLLFKMKPTDPLALLSAGTLLLAVAAVAAWLPARRAATIDPIEALRYE